MKINAKLANLIAILAITIYMGYAFLFTDKTAKDVALVGIVMAVLNSGVPISVYFDKLIEVRKYKDGNRD